MFKIKINLFSYVSVSKTTQTCTVNADVVKMQKLIVENRQLNFFILITSLLNSLPATAAYKRARECVNLLQCWKNSYMETRAYIEDTGVGSRWEFDKKTLFGLVDHVTRISQDVADIAKVKNQTRIILCNGS